mmetsp:Transcript_44016/g.127076  ORF Transcript_44016/g.127076 Transcript_44016/m.127076 type:complete len:375 (-) Transcript_44016:1182-2306(-)
MANSKAGARAASCGSAPDWRPTRQPARGSSATASAPHRRSAVTARPPGAWSRPRKPPPTKRRAMWRTESRPTIALPRAAATTRQPRPQRRRPSWASASGFALPPGRRRRHRCQRRGHSWGREPACRRGRRSTAAAGARRLAGHDRCRQRRLTNGCRGCYRRPTKWTRETMWPPARCHRRSLSGRCAATRCAWRTRRSLSVGSAASRGCTGVAAATPAGNNQPRPRPAPGAATRRTSPCTQSPGVTQRPPHRCSSHLPDTRHTGHPQLGMSPPWQTTSSLAAARTRRASAACSLARATATARIALQRGCGNQCRRSWRPPALCVAATAASQLSPEAPSPPRRHRFPGADSCSARVQPPLGTPTSAGPTRPPTSLA